MGGEIPFPRFCVIDFAKQLAFVLFFANVPRVSVGCSLLDRDLDRVSEMRHNGANDFQPSGDCANYFYSLQLQIRAPDEVEGGESTCGGQLNISLDETCSNNLSLDRYSNLFSTGNRRAKLTGAHGFCLDSKLVGFL